MQIKCTSCGSTQELAANHQCGYCGSAIEQEKAQENYKASTTGEVGNLMMMAETAVDATNWEEALQYYNKALEKDITNSDAWLGKGIAMVYTSKIGDIKTKEAIAYWKNAIKHAENADAMGKRVAKEINTVVNAFYPAIENHYIEFHDLDNSYAELISRFTALESAQDYAIQLNSENIEFCQTGYALCQRVINLSEKRFYKGFGKTIREIQRKYILLIENIDPNNPLVLKKRKTDELESKAKSGCFIATAAMGDYDHPVVMDLRSFRDNWLNQRKWGKNFISWYYVKGPVASKIIEKSIFLRKITFYSVVKPLHFLTKNLR